MSGYWGASHSRRFRNFEVRDRGPNSLLSSEGETIRARARQEVRGSSQGSAAARAFKVHVVGEGIKPRSLHSEDRRARQLDELWARTAETLDADGVDDAYGMQATVARALFVDGEAFLRKRVRRPEDGLLLQVQGLEADLLPLSLVFTPKPLNPRNNVIGGIEVDSIGRRVAYHFFQEHPRDQVNWRTGSVGGLLTRAVPADQVLHVFERDRLGQMRGETRLAPVVEALWQQIVYSVAEMDRAGLASRLNAVIEQAATADAEALSAFGEQPTNTGEANPTADGALDLDIGGIEIPVLEPGQKLTWVDIKQLAGEFEKFSLVKNHEVGAGCGVPYELITGDFSRVTFASARTALRAFQRVVQQVQRLLTVQMCRPQWAWMVDEAFQRGELQDYRYPANRREYLAAEWTAPRVEFVDPLKEYQAYGEAMELNLMSRRQAIAELGNDFKAVDQEIAADKLHPKRQEKAAPGTPAKDPAAAQQQDEGDKQGATGVMLQ